MIKLIAAFLSSLIHTPNDLGLTQIFNQTAYILSILCINVFSPSFARRLTEVYLKSPFKSDVWRGISVLCIKDVYFFTYVCTL